MSTDAVRFVVSQCGVGRDSELYTVGMAESHRYVGHYIDLEKL